MLKGRTMELNYNFKIKTTDVKSALKKADSPTDADIYINKKHNWLSYKLDINKDSEFIFESELLSETRLNTKTVFKVNTLNVMLTDIVVEGVPYFYKLNVKSLSKIYSKDTFMVDLNIKDVIEYNNNFYTNNELYIFNSSNDYVYTSKVISVKDCNCIYRPEHIEIEAPPNSEILLKEFVLTPQLINQYSFYTPSFYIKNSSNITVQCIESDIKIFDSKIQVNEGDYLKYKVEDNLGFVGLLPDFNISFDKNIKDNSCRYRLSSHCFEINDFSSYYLINLNGTIEKSDKDNYTFKVSKIVNIEYIDIIANTYKYLDKSFEDIRGFYVNSYQEVNSGINSFGMTYNKIDTRIPYLNYINKISYSDFNFSKNPKLKVKALKDNATSFRVLPKDLSSNKNYIQCDNINYFIKE